MRILQGIVDTMRLLFTIMSYLLLSACILVGPNYKEPIKPVTPHWKKNDKSVIEKPIRNMLWWNVFRDPTLSLLIKKGYENNLTLHSAAVRVLQARAQLAQTVGELYPQQQTLNGSFIHERIGGSSLQTVLPSNFYLASLGANATWELDFWGKYRRAILANDANFLASYAAYDNALVSLTADIAITYINIRTTEELISVTKKNIEVQKQGLQIAESRFKNGESSLLDVEQAKTELYQTEATLPGYISELQKQKDLLAVLLGTTPNHIDPLLKGRHGIPKALPKVAVGIPKETMINRPDIFQARLRAISQSESIGAIKATLFPSFSLSGSFAFSSNNINNNSLGDLFNWSNRTTTAGPAFAWPILNYGQITNQVRMVDALFQEALLNYINTVLKAQQEVQDNITKYIESQKAVNKLSIANNAAVKTTELALVQYREGETDFTTVLYSEQQQLKVETSLTESKGDVSKALASLYRSLGGGWVIRGCNDIVPEQIKRQMAARTNWGSLLKQKNHQPADNKWQVFKERYLPNW